MTTASELGMKVKNLNPSLIKDTEQMKGKSICSPEMDQSAINPVKGNKIIIQFHALTLQA